MRNLTQIHGARTRIEAARSLRVALIYEVRSAYDTKVMTGVANYIQESPGWNVYIEENALKDQRLPNLKAWKGDGIIANFDHPRVAAAVVRSGLPAVAFGSGYGWYSAASEIPYFFTNNTAIAAAAADHLISKGLRNFAFCGYPSNRINGWSSERQESFKAELAKRGFSCSVYPAKPATDATWVSLQRSIGDWVRALPKPVGILASNDIRGRQILESCRDSSLRVPEEVAVLGVDNDELLCNLSSPLLSSIEQGAKRLGYEAARLLNTLITRPGSIKTKRFIIDPFGVITRASTDVLAIEDPKLAKAMEYIARHFAEGVSVENVVAATGMSRSALEKKFRAELGSTVGSTIRRMQSHRARELVLTTSLPLKEIAANLSYPSVQHMTTVFQKTFGRPPGQLRRLLASGAFK
ncbi:MAG: DNA-binding transcriptional regulator [Terracidiphilus sp.]